MVGPQRCDIAIWDVNGELPAGVRRQLKRFSRHEGPQIMVESGDWLGRRVAIGVPQRLTAARAGTLSGCLRAMSLGHPARLRVVIGPATMIAGRGVVGDALIATSVNSATEAIRLETLPSMELFKSGPLGDGPVLRSADVAMTTDWAAVVARAAEEGTPTVVVAVATVVSGAESVTPPPSRRRTLARETGLFLGRLFKGQFDDGSNANCAEKAAQALAAIVQSR